MEKQKNRNEFIINRLLEMYEKTNNVKYLKEVDKRLAITNNKW